MLKLPTCNLRAPPTGRVSSNANIMEGFRLQDYQIQLKWFKVIAKESQVVKCKQRLDGVGQVSIEVL